MDSLTSLVSAARPAFPYPGLRPFESDEWSIFFGREAMIDEVIDRLANQRVVLIHGASGSGKSSLVRAGVLPRLARQSLGRGTEWCTCAMRPSGGPLWNLAAALADLEGRGGDIDRYGEIIRLFNRRGTTLSSVVAQIDRLAGKRLCILVDQFEELFRFERESSREEAELFVRLIIGELPEELESDTDAEDDDAQAAFDQSGCDLHIVLTMRSEFLSDCARFDGFAEAVNRTQYLVPRMPLSSLRRAICHPARLYGGEVTAELADRLIDNVRGRLDELPLIQHGLMLFWHQTEQANSGQKIVLDAEMLERAGGLDRLLSDHADRVLKSAAPDDRQSHAVERLFRALTDINVEGQAIRRPQTFEDLMAVCGVPAKNLHIILDAYRAEGVSFLTPYSPAVITDKTIIDISHEALIRCWRTIADPQDGWLRREFDDGLVWRSLLIEAAEFHYDKSRMLSPAATVERRRWFKTLPRYWSERYGGNWPAVERLLLASHRSRIRKQRTTRILSTPVILLVWVGIFAVAEEFTPVPKPAVYTEFQTSLYVIILWLSIEIVSWLFDYTRSFLRSIRNIGKITDTLPIIYGKPSRAKTTIRKKLTLLARRNWIPLTVTVSIIILSVFVFNNPYLECALGSIDESGKNYENALYIYGRAANSGNAKAQDAVGQLYRDGRGVDQDYARAIEWFRKAGDQGYVSSQNSLGFIYHKGPAEFQDYTQAMIWYRKAADQNDSSAQNNIGALYDDGLGMPAADYAQAMTWYRKAADQGAAAAKYHIGILYAEGHGVPQDTVEAQRWMQAAAKGGEARATAWLDAHKAPTAPRPPAPAVPHESAPPGP